MAVLKDQLYKLGYSQEEQYFYKLNLELVRKLRERWKGCDASNLDRTRREGESRARERHKKAA